MFFRFTKIDFSRLLEENKSFKDNYNLSKKIYLCMVNALTRTKVNFLCPLHEQLINKIFIIEINGKFWLPKTFDSWAKEFGVDERIINRVITSLRNDEIISI